MIDHDRLFKELLFNFFPDFIDLFLPYATVHLKRDSITPLSQEVFTDVTSGDRYEADLLVQAHFREQDSLFIIHFEHQSCSEADFNQRMFRYCLYLHKKHAMQVYPIVLFSPGVQYSEAHYRAEFPYDSIQLSRLQWQDFANQQNPVASALMSKMRMNIQERPIVKVASLQLLSSLGLNLAQRQLISGFIDIYLKLNSEEEVAFQEELARLEPVQQEEVMEIVTSWIEEGIQRGLQQGRQEGRQQEAVSLILRLLTRRLGSVDPEVQEHIQSLSVAQLENLGEALLDFSRVADLTTWLQNN